MFPESTTTSAPATSAMPGRAAPGIARTLRGAVWRHREWQGGGRSGHARLRHGRRHTVDVDGAPSAESSFPDFSPEGTSPRTARRTSTARQSRRPRSHTWVELAHRGETGYRAEEPPSRVLPERPTPAMKRSGMGVTPTPCEEWVHQLLESSHRQVDVGIDRPPAR